MYKTQTEGERVNKNLKDKEDWKASPTPLPPSPPLNRTPISKVKERAKTQTTRSRVYNKRSKSSPPTSRKAHTLHRSCETSHEEKREEPIKRSAILDKVDRHVKEIDELKGQLSLALCEKTTAEKELSRLRQRKTDANQQVEELLRNLKIAENELKLKSQELENFEKLKQRYSALLKEHEGMLKSWRESAINDGWREMYQQLKEEYASDKESWEIKLEDVTSMLRVASERCEMLTEELTLSEENVQVLKSELTNLSERLMRGLEENEGLYGRMRELEGRCLSSSRERGRSVDSLSDLTNVDLDINLETLNKERIIEEYEELKGRFEKAVQEIRAMKKELRESHANYDDLELTVINLRQDAKRKEENGKAQAELMASRIEDLTLKLSASEKQSRVLKQKIAKSDSREKRRSLSLKGKESFYIGKETEEKLAELEAKLEALESGKQTSVVVKSPTAPFEKKVREEEKEVTRCRRKSLESSPCSEPMKILVRMFSLERKIIKAAECLNEDCKNAQTDSNQAMESSEGILKIRRKLQECKSIIGSLKRKNQITTLEDFSSLEKCIIETEQLLKKYKFLSSPLAKENPLKFAGSEDHIIHSLESILKSKISELSERKQALIERNEFNEEAKLSLTAEKLAYESVLIRKIRQVLNECNLVGNQWKQSIDYTEIQEIKALMTLIVNKIEGENITLTGNALDGLSKIISKTLYLEGEVADYNSKVVKILLEKNDFNMDYKTLLEHHKTVQDLVNAYKKKKLEEIALSLAYDTFYQSTEMEESKKQEFKADKRLQKAWSLAQESLNKELAQVELSQLALRCLLMYKNELAKEQEGRLTFIAEKYRRKEKYLEKIEDSLRNAVDCNVSEIYKLYEKIFKKLREEEKEIQINDGLKEESKKYKKAMEDFFSVAFQMTIVDVKVLFLTEELDETKDKNDQTVFCRAGPVNYNHNHVLEELDFETRFIYLYQKFSAECLKSVEGSKFCLNNSAAVLKNLKHSVEKIKNLREMLQLPESSASLPNLSHSNSNNILDHSAFISNQLEDFTRCTKGKHLCRQCCLLKEALRNVENHYDEEIRILKLCHQKEMKVFLFGFPFPIIIIMSRLIGDFFF